MNERPMCKNCMFWGPNMAPDYHGDEEDEGICARYPPMLLKIEDDSEDDFPSIESKNWHQPWVRGVACCGEFKEA